MTPLENKLMTVIAENVDLSEQEKDLLVRLNEYYSTAGYTKEEGSEPTFVENLFKEQFNGSEEDFIYYVKNDMYKKKDIYHNEIPGTEEAKRVLLKAINKKKKVYFYSDSDNDGKCAMAIYNEFQNTVSFNDKVSSLADTTIKHIKTPITATHGINAHQVIRDFEMNAENGPVLIMTADNGISSQPEIDTIQKYCDENDIQIDFLITDHHIPDKETGVNEEAKNVTVLDMELNEDHGPDTISGAQTLGDLLKDVLAEIDENHLKEGANRDSFNLIADEIGHKFSSVADVIPGAGKKVTEEELNIFGGMSSRHNKLRAFDYFLKNMPKNYPTKPIADKIEKLCSNFLRYMEGPLEDLENKLNSRPERTQASGFTSMPKIQPYIMLLEIKVLNKVASKEERNKLDIFKGIEEMYIEFRRKTVEEIKSRKKDVFSIQYSPELELKAIEEEGISSALANQVQPSSSVDVALTITPMKDGIIRGSFRSNGIELQELLGSDKKVIERLEASGITEVWAKGHAVAAGFHCRVEPGVENIQEILFEELSIAVNDSKKKTVNLEETKRVELSKIESQTMKKLLHTLGVNGAPGDFSPEYTIDGEKEYAVVVQDGGSRKIEEATTNGFIPASDVVYQGVEDLNGKNIVHKGNSAFAKAQSEETHPVTALKSAEKTDIKNVSMQNIVDETIPAETWMRNNPLGYTEAYLEQIKDALQNPVNKLDSVSELDIESTGLAKKDELTNIGILTFTIEDGELKATRNSILIKTGNPTSNFIEDLTGITNKTLEEEGIDLSDADKLFKSMFEDGSHEIRAFNAMFDFRGIIKNLVESNDVIKNNIVFSDTLEIAKKYKLGSYSEYPLVDIKDPETQVTIVHAARVEDVISYMNGDLEVITSTTDKETYKGEKFDISNLINMVNGEKPNKKEINLNLKASRKGSNSVQSIMTRVWCEEVYPEAPYKFKQIISYSDKKMENPKFLAKVSEETGISEDEINIIIKRRDEWNDSSTQEQKEVMEMYGLQREELFKEVHNNTGPMGDNELEGVAVIKRLEQMGYTQEQINNFYNTLYSPEKHQKNCERYNPLTPKIEIKYIASPNSTNPPVYLLVPNRKVTEEEDSLVKKTVNLQIMGATKTPEYKALVKKVDGLDLKFKIKNPKGTSQTVLYDNEDNPQSTPNTEDFKQITSFKPMLTEVNRTAGGDPIYELKVSGETIQKKIKLLPQSTQRQRMNNVVNQANIYIKSNPENTSGQQSQKMKVNTP